MAKAQAQALAQALALAEESQAKAVRFGGSVWLQLSPSLALSLWRNQLSLSCFWQRHRGLQFIIIIIIIFFACACACVTRGARARAPQTGWDDAQLQQPKAKHETRDGQQQLQKWDLLLLQRMMMGMMIIIKKHSNFIAHFRSPLKRVLSAGGGGLREGGRGRER